MPRAHVPGIRQAIFRLADQGLSAAAIARQLGLPPSTVRDLLRRHRLVGTDALRPDYQACGRHHTHRYSPLLATLLHLHHQHPGWGAGRLRVELVDLRPDLDPQQIPCTRTLQRWLRRQRIPPARSGRPTVVATARSRLPHQVWGMDAVEQLSLATGQLVSWLRLTDEASGAILQTAIFPPRALQPSTRVLGAAAVAVRVGTVGPTRNPQGRQRLALGFVERLANTFGVVVDWSGSALGVDCTAVSATERRDGTQPRCDPALGRCESVSKRGGTASSRGSGRSSATGEIPAPGIAFA